jgi:RNA polymerase primary sigma factor
MKNYDKQIINKKYYQDLSKFDTLTSQDIKDLYILINQGDTTSKNKLIESNLKLVIHFAKQYRSILNKTESIELDDLISEGNIGLIRAVERFNPDLNIKFSYYASFWIKKGINDFLMNQADLIRSPQKQTLAINKIGKVVETLFQKNQYEIFQNDIEELNQFTQSEINHFFYAKPYANRIEATDDFKADEEIFEEDDVNYKLKQSMKYLTSQERTVIKMYFGFDNANGDKIVLQEIGDELKLTKARIQQIRDKALIKLKERMQ